MKSSSSSLAPTLSLADAASPGLGSFAKTLAFMSPLMMVGSLAAQEAPAAAPAPDAAKDKDAKGTDVVELPAVTVEGAATPKLSSPKFTQPLVDTPQTVVVIPREVYKQQGASSLQDVLRNTPGISFTASENSGVLSGDSFLMRGSDMTNSIFVDGFRDTGSYGRDIYNIEQVEVAKGPSGENGRAEAGGYVNLSSKVARLETIRDVETIFSFDDYDSKERYRATFDFNQPLDAKFLNGTAIRLNTLWQDGGVAGREYAEANKIGVSPSIGIGLAGPTRLYLSYDYMQQRNVPDRGVPGALVPGLPAVLPPGVQRPERDTFYGYVTDYDDIDSHRVTARVDHDISPDLKLSNQTRYGVTDRIGYYATPASSITANPLFPSGGSVTRAVPNKQGDTTTAIFANQTNFTANFDTGAIKHALSTGLELSHETSYNRSWASTGNTVTPGTTDASNPDVNPVITGTPVRNGFTDATTDTAGIYAYDTLTLHPRVLLSLGGRLEHYDTEVRNATTATQGDGPLHSYRTAFTYKPVANGSIYAAYGMSMRPPGTNFSFSTNATNADNVLLDPQEAYNYELGTKWELFDKRALLTFAVFKSENTNLATTDSVTNEVVQVADQEVIGFELGLSGNITENWLIFAGYAQQDAEYSAPSYTAAGAIDGAELSGNPRYSANLWTSYKLPIPLTIGGGAKYFGKSNRRQMTAATSQEFTLPAYTLFDLMAAYEISKNVSVRLNVDNVFDKLYIRGSNVGSGTGTNTRVYLGDPRVYKLSLSVSF